MLISQRLSTAHSATVSAGYSTQITEHRAAKSITGSINELFVPLNNEQMPIGLLLGLATAHCPVSPHAEAKMDDTIKETKETLQTRIEQIPGQVKETSSRVKEETTRKVQSSIDTAKAKTSNAVRSSIDKLTETTDNVKEKTTRTINKNLNNATDAIKTGLSKIPIPFEGSETKKNVNGFNGGANTFNGGANTFNGGANGANGDNRWVLGENGS